MCFPVLATYIATEIRREQPLVCVGSNVDQRSVRLDKNFIWYISLYLQLVYSEVTAWRRVGEMVKAGEKWKRRVKATNAPSFQPPWASFPSALKSREALHPPLIPSGSLSTPQVADARRSAFSTSQSWPRRVPPASHLLFFSFLSTLRPLVSRYFSSSFYYLAKMHLGKIFRGLRSRRTFDSIIATSEFSRFQARSTSNRRYAAKLDANTKNVGKSLDKSNPANAG